MSCKEFILDDLTAIVAIPIEKYTPSGKTAISPTIAKASFSPTIDSTAITIGTTAQAGSLIPIIRSTGKVKDAEAVATAGRLHTVNVDCEVDGRDADTWNTLRKLERQAKHLILTSKDGTKFFVYGSEDTCLFQVDRNGSKTSVSFRLQCLMGLQMIV